MAAGGPGWPKGTKKVVKHVTTDPHKLDQIADVLEIPKSERRGLWAAELHMREPENGKKSKKGKKGKKGK